MLATGGYDKLVRIYDAETGAVVKTLAGHQLSVSRVVFNPIGNLVVSGLVFCCFFFSSYFV
jgi:WD40 repeat protein